VSEDLYRTVLEDQTEVIVRFRADGTLIYVNEAYCRLFGKRVAELVGNKWQPLAFAEDLPHIEAELAKLSPTNPVVVVENRSYSVTGELPWMQFVNRAFFDAKGHLTEIQAVGRDITELKRVEAELRSRQAELQAIYEHAPFMLCLLDEHRRVIFANHSFAAYIGRSPEGCFLEVACGVLGCINALDDPKGCGYGPKCNGCALRRAILDTIETGSSHHNVEHVTTVVQQGQKREATWLASTARVPVEDGPQVLLALQDITEYRQAEADLRASEARLRAIFDNSVVGILFTAPDGRVFSANPAAGKILGRSQEQICKLGRYGLVDPKSPNLDAVLAERARTGKVHAQLTYIRGDGTRFPADTASVIFDTAEGRRTCTIIQDVSEREAAAERVRDFSRRVLAAREEERHRLSAALHHDVGSMTVGVSARLQAAEEDLCSGKPQEALAALKECRQLFDESVQRLKALAMELRPPDLDILGLPIALRQHFARVTRNASLRISFTDATHGVAIEPDIETTLFRVAQECLNNVIKHAEANRVRVRLAIGKRRIELSIADDGKGIDPDLAAGRSGSGMGLRAVREMIRAQGGELTMDSTPGKGTRIRAAFPLGGA
jgi:PAS domain S-box-containing protein